MADKLPLPDEQPNAVRALRNKRAELAGRIAMHNAEITRLRNEVIHLGALLRLFDRETDPNDLPARRHWPRRMDWFARGETAQIVYDAMRNRELLSATSLADATIKAKGIEAPDQATRREIIARFSNMLYTLARREELVKIGRGPGARWKPAPNEPNLI